MLLDVYDTYTYRALTDKTLACRPEHHDPDIEGSSSFRKALKVLCLHCRPQLIRGSQDVCFWVATAKGNSRGKHRQCKTDEKHVRTVLPMCERLHTVHSIHSKLSLNYDLYLHVDHAKPLADIHFVMQFAVLVVYIKQVV